MKRPSQLTTVPGDLEAIAQDCVDTRPDILIYGPVADFEAPTPPDMKQDIYYEVRPENRTPDIRSPKKRKEYAKGIRGKVLGRYGKEFQDRDTPVDSGERYRSIADSLKGASTDERIKKYRQMLCVDGTLWERTEAVLEMDSAGVFETSDEQVLNFCYDHTRRLMEEFHTIRDMEGYMILAPILTILEARIVACLPFPEDFYGQDCIHDPTIFDDDVNQDILDCFDPFLDGILDEEEKR